MKYCTSLAGVLHLILCTAALRCSTFFKYSFGSSIVLAVVLHFVSTGLLKRRSPFFFQKLEPLSPLHRENGQHCRRRSFLNQEITTRWSQSVVLYIYNISYMYTLSKMKKKVLTCILVALKVDDGHSLEA